MQVQFDAGMSTSSNPLPNPKNPHQTPTQAKRTKDVHHTVGSYSGLTLLCHNAEVDVPMQKSAVPRQKMTESSWNMFEKEEKKGADFMSSAKKQGRSMFATSENLFGEGAFVPKGNAKKFSAVKIAEIGGTDPAN